MFEQEFEKLNMADQEAFRRMVNWMLAHTYLLQGDYAFEDNMRRTNPDYLFVERNFELFQSYLGVRRLPPGAGHELRGDFPCQQL